MKVAIIITALAIGALLSLPVAAGYDANLGGTTLVSGDSSAPPIAFDKKPAVGTEATCPVMGHAFKIKADSLFSEYKGKFYFFCCPGCKPKFDADPEKYINKG